MIGERAFAVLAGTGLAVLAGRHVGMRLPAARPSATASGFRGDLVFGLAYGTVSLSCTLPIFLAGVYVAYFWGDSMFSPDMPGEGNVIVLGERLSAVLRSWFGGTMGQPMIFGLLTLLLALYVWIDSPGLARSWINLDSMIQTLRLLLHQFVVCLKSRAELHIENLVLRHQIEILRRSAPPRVRLTKTDRLIPVGPR